MKKIKVYLASGWFSDNQREVIDNLEELLSKRSDINHYFPRHDGIKLNPNEFHDHSLREKIFLSNVDNIVSADFVIANFDCRDGFFDTGTVWEAGYAASHGIPVIAFDTTGKFREVFTIIKSQFCAAIYDYEELNRYLSEMIKKKEDSQVKKGRVLFVGPDDTEEQVEFNKDIVSVLFENCGRDIRWLDDLSNCNFQNDAAEKLFENVEYVVAVIDDRHPIVSWIMGQAYERNIPIITYTNHDYTVNIMLLFSIVAHCKGKESLKEVVQKIKRSGVESLPAMDTTNMRAE